MATPVIQFARAADGVQIAFAAVGDGRPLVLCDGPFQPLRRGWSQGIADRLAGWFQVVRLDHRGTGRSDRQAQPEGLASQVLDLEAVVDEIGAGPFALCGYSHGAHAAIAFAARHPERVTHLVIYGAPGPNQTPRSAQQQQYDAAFDRLLEQALMEENLFARRAFAMAMIPSASLPDLDQYAEEFVEHITAGVMLAYNDASRASTIELVAPDVTAPTLVLHVAADPLEEFAGGQRLAALIPGARLLSLDGTDHLLRANQPETETFVAELVNFVGAPAEAKPTSPASELTPREREVIELLARGDSNQEIAHALGLSVRTVERHVENLYRKIAARGRADAIAYALRHDLVAHQPSPRPLG
ncbi:MAG: alpha/beta fold hydrolase [Chloroflexi bacterium]|nr:alpha/beta fold hydrolase [Chloroflexota bacterium]